MLFKKIFFPSFSAESTYESLLVNNFFHFLNRFFLLLPRESHFLGLIKTLPWKTILLFAFVFFLAISPDSSTTQVSKLVASSKVDLSQKLTVVETLNLSGLLFLPILVLLIRQLAKVRLNFILLDMVLLLFLLTSELATITGFNVRISLTWLLKLSYGLAIYFVFSKLQLNMKELKIILYAFLGTIFLEGILAVLQFMIGGFIGIPLENARKLVSYQTPYSLQGFAYFRAAGTFSQANLLTLYLSLLLPVATALTFWKKSFLKYLSFGAIFVCLTIPLLSLSRWGLVTMLFGFFSFFFLAYALVKISLKKVLPSFKVGFGVLLLLFLIILSTQLTTNRFLTYSADAQRNTQARLQLITEAYYLIKENFFLGVGPNNFLAYFTNYDITIRDVSLTVLYPVHNIFLLTFSETGVFGFLSLLLFIIVTTRLFFAKRKNLPQNLKILATSFLVSFLTFFFSGLWNLRTFDDRGAFLFWLLLGLMVNLLSRPENFTNNPSPSSAS